MANYTLPDLRYDYGALEPHISGKIMELHHDKHHAAYVKGANTALEKLDEARDKEDFTRLAALGEGARLQPVGPRPALALLAEPDAEGRGPPAGRARRGDRRRLRRFREAEEADDGGGRHDHGVGLGGARLGAARQAASDDADLRPPVEPRAGRGSDPRARRLGARLLPAVPEPQDRVLRGDLERLELAGRREAVRSGARGRRRAGRSG